MRKLVLVRHGESTWNLENRFTGWVDVDLTEEGIRQATQAGRLLKDHGYIFDVAYTSVLKRAIRTLWQIQSELDLMWIPTIHNWRLNERHYGALTGLNKADMVKQYGEEQVLIWRRSYDTPPPPLSQDKVELIQNDPRYARLSPADIPFGECLKDTVNRVLPLWTESIAPSIQLGKRVIISAHGNSIRGLVKLISNLSDDEIVNINIPNGVPLVYEFDEQMRPNPFYFLGDPDQIAKAISTVANQGKQ